MKSKPIITAAEDGLSLHIDLTSVDAATISRVRALATAAAGDGPYLWQEFYRQLDQRLASALALQELNASELLADALDDPDAKGALIPKRGNDVPKSGT